MADAHLIPRTAKIDIPALEQRLAELERARADEHQSRLRALAEPREFPPADRTGGRGARRAASARSCCRS